MEHNVYPIRRSDKAKVADGREIPIQTKTRLEHLTVVLTPWAPVEVKLALAVLPGVDAVLTIGSKYMRDDLIGIDVLATLEEKMMRGAATEVYPDEEARAAT